MRASTVLGVQVVSRRRSSSTPLLFALLPVPLLQLAAHPCHVPPVVTAAHHEVGLQVAILRPPAQGALADTQLTGGLGGRDERHAGTVIDHFPVDVHRGRWWPLVA